MVLGCHQRERGALLERLRRAVQRVSTGGRLLLVDKALRVDLETDFARRAAASRRELERAPRGRRPAQKAVT